MLRKNLSPFFSLLSAVFILTPLARAQYVQQGNKLVGTGAVTSSLGVLQGTAVAASSDGNTIIVGAEDDNNGVGAAWIFTRANGAWTQQGDKLVGTGANGPAHQGASVDLSADGNTAIVGGPSDSNLLGAAWVYTRSGGVWTQQFELVGTGGSTTATQGTSVALSSDGSTAIIGGPHDGTTGAVWVFTRSGGVWTQPGQKLVGTGWSPALGTILQGYSVSLTADGNTAIVGGPGDSQNQGAVWIFTRSGNTWTQVAKLVGANATVQSFQGSAVALSGDGSTALVGGMWDSASYGAVWVFTLDNGTWSQQGGKLSPSSGVAWVGAAVALSGDGNTALVGGPQDSSGVGAAWIFKRASGAWSQQSKLTASDATSGTVLQGTSVALSADGFTAIVGGPDDTSGLGAAWAFFAPAHFQVSAPSPAIAGTQFNFTVTAQDANNNTLTGYTGTVHFTSSDGNAVLPADATLTNGTAIFPATLETSGSQTITATDTVTASITGTSGAIVVGSATTHFLVSAPAHATPGTAFTFTVTAQDASNNIVPAYAGTVHLTSTDTFAALPPDSALVNGTATFSATLKTPGSQTIHAADTGTPSLTGTSGTIAVAAWTAQHFLVTASASAVAGTAFNFTVTAQDANNNTLTGFTSMVQFSSSDPSAVLPAPSTLVNGTGTFLATLKTAGSQSITASYTCIAPGGICWSSVTGNSGAIVVSAATAAHLALTAPTSATAGSTVNFTVSAKDAYNNPVSSYAGTVHFTSSDAAAVLPANAAVTNGTGTFAAALRTSGSQTIAAADVATASIAGTSGAIVVTGGAATHLVVTAPAGASSGVAFQFTVTAQDVYNNPSPSYAGTVHFSSTDGQAVLPANAVLANGTGTFSATLKTQANQNLTATDVATASITGTSAAISVGGGPAAHFLVTAPANATAGTSFNFTVTAQDAGNNTSLGYSGTVKFTSTDGSAVLPANATLTAGTGTFPATFKTVGNQTLTATDTLTAAITGTSGTVALSSAAATHFAVTAPATATAGTALNATVTARDAYNNTSTGYSGTVHITSSDGAALLPADATLTGGTGSLSVTLKTAGSQTVTATDTVTASITGISSAITVGGGAATHLAVTAPATATAGTAINVTVTAQDAYNNTSSGYAGTVHITSSDTAAALPANATLTNGTGSLAVTLKTSGSQTVIATDTVTASITGTSGAIVVGGGAATHLSVTAPATAAAGTAFNFTVTAQDANNNTAAGYTGTVHFTSSDAAAVLPANATLTNGTATFSATLKTAGNWTITGTDTATASITGVTGAIAVAASAATHYAVAAPATATAGTAFNFTVTAKDAYNNTAPSYVGTAHISSSDTAATLGADAALTSGVGTFAATLKTPGSQTVAATDTVTASITGTSAAIAVGGGAATHFSITAPSSASAGTAFNFTVTALDASNNTSAGYAGTVQFTSSDTAAVLPANAKLTNGTGAFSAALRTLASQTLTATDTVTASITGASGAIAVAAGPAAHFAVSVPASAVAGTSFNFTVTAQDAGNNPIATYAGTVHFTSSDSAAVLPANTTLTNGTGSFPAVLKTGGNQTLTAADTVTATIAGTSAAIAVTGGVATRLAVSAPALVTAGAAFAVTVTALDAYNNTSPAYAGTVHFAATDALAGVPADSTLTNGKGTFTATLKTAGSQSLTATDTVTASIAGTSAAITAAGGAATHFAVSAPASAAPGTPFGFTVTALDAYNNVSTGYAGTMQCTSSDPAAVLPANWMLSNGTGSFSATLKSPGNQTITATDTAAASITGSSAAIVVGGGTLAVGANPGWGTGASQTMTFTFSDPRGWQDLDVVNVLIDNFLDGRNACYLAYSRTASVLYLVNDSGNGLLPGLALSGSGTLGNSQCTVTGAGSSVAGSGNTLTLTLNLSFTAGFAGNKVTYLAARDLEGGNSGWQALGTWGVPGTNWSGPEVMGTNPARATGSGTQMYTFTFADTNGWQDLGVVNVLINDDLDGYDACYLAYSRAANILYLVNDAGTALLPGVTLDGSASASNSQCSVSGVASGSGNTLTLMLNVTFTPSFTGNRLIYLAARSNGDTLNSGWQAVGSRTVQ